MNTSVLKVSEAASLAMHSCAILAAHMGRPLSVGAVASVLEASEAHLSKVFQDLTRVGLVRSSRGPKGGFSLDRPPDEVTLLDVYEAIDGRLQTASCISLHRPTFCRGERCILGGLVNSVNEQARAYLSKTRLSQLAGIFSGLDLDS